MHPDASPLVASSFDNRTIDPLTLARIVDRILDDKFLRRISHASRFTPERARLPAIGAIKRTVSARSLLA